MWVAVPVGAGMSLRNYHFTRFGKCRPRRRGDEPIPSGVVAAPRGQAPHSRVEGRTFELVVDLPWSAKAGSLAPDRKKTRKPLPKTTSRKPAKKNSPKAKKPKPRVEPTPAEVEARKQKRREYDRQRAQNPERKEQHRCHTAAKRNEAKSLGRCVTCRATPIPGETRAENHRKYSREAKAKKTQARAQASGQTSFF